MSNISLGGNHGNSINFDGAVLQNQQEDEYRKEEEQQQNELRALLTTAFDDLIDDDDILSITSEEGTDSRNVSLVRRHSNDSLGRPPTEERIEEERGEGEWPETLNRRKLPASGEQQVQESMPAGFPHHLARRYGRFDPLSRTQELKRENIQALRASVESLPSFPTTSHDLTDRSSSIHGSEHLDSDYHSNAGDCDNKPRDFHGVVYPQQHHQGHGHVNIQGQGRGNQNYVNSEQHVNIQEQENMLRRSIEDFNQLREAYQGQGHVEQFYGEQGHHHQLYHHQHQAEQPYDQAQGQIDVNHPQGHYYQGHDAGGHQVHHHGYQDNHHHFKNIYENRPYHTIGEREEAEGGNVKPVQDGHYYNHHLGYGYHDNMGYYRNDYGSQGQEVTGTNYNEIPQGHVPDHHGYPTQDVPEVPEFHSVPQPQPHSTGTSVGRRLPNIQKHLQSETDKKDNKNQNNYTRDGQKQKNESGRGQKSGFPDGHKVTYKREQSEKGKGKKDKLDRENSEESTRDDRAFIEQGGSMDQQQLAQLQILYKARGKKIEELNNELEVIKGDASRDLRILKHQLSVAKAEKEGSGRSLDSVQDLLQEVKEENSQLIGKLHAAESQIEGLKRGKDEMIKKLQTAESTIESLHQHLEDLGSSDSLTRARHDHENVVTGLQKKYEAEIKHLQEKISELNSTLIEKDDMVKLLNQKLTDSVKSSEQAQISRAETMNRLTQSLEESQKRCRNLLESTSSQDLSQMKIQLQQALASRTISDEMCSSLQDEILDLKEQVQMLESASTLGVSTQPTGNTFADQNDSMADLGIKKTLDFDTPQNTPVIVKSQSKVSNEVVGSLKAELERCLISNKQKRSEVNTLKEELKTLRKDLVEYKQRFEEVDIQNQQQKQRISALEDGIHSGDKANAVENRLKKDVDNLKREKKILTEDIQELQRRLEEISQSEEKLTELNRELSKQIADMVKEYDQDKREAIERVQRACEQVSETSRSQIRQELTIQFDGERSVIISKYEKELNNLRVELKTAEAEIDRVKELYVSLCEDKDKLKQHMDAEWSQRLQQDIQKVKEDMQKESELSMLRAEESWEKKSESELNRVKAELQKEFDNEKTKAVEEVNAIKVNELQLAKEKFEQEIKSMKDIMEIERSNDLEKIDKQKLNEIEKLRNLINDKEGLISNLEKEKSDILKSKEDCDKVISEVKFECSKLLEMKAEKVKEMDSLRTDYEETIEVLKEELNEKAREVLKLNSDLEVLKQSMEKSLGELQRQKGEEIGRVRKDMEKLIQEKENELEKLRKKDSEKDEVDHLRKEIDKNLKQTEVEALKKEVICLKLEIERMDNDKHIEIDKVCRVKQSEIENLEKRKHNEIERLKKEKAMELERLTREKDDELSKLKEKSGKSSENEGDVSSKFKDRLNKELEESIQKAVEGKVAMSKVVWLEEHRATRQTAIDNAVRLAEAELKLKMEADLDDKLQKRLEEAKILWQSDSFQQLEDERRNWETHRDDEIKQIVHREHEKWRQTELKAEIEIEEEKWLKDFEQRLDEERQKWSKEFDQRLDEERSSWLEVELETEKLKWTSDWETKLQEEKDNWQRNIMEPAKKKWKHDVEERLRSEKDNWRCMELEPEKLNLMREFETRLQKEKQAWMSKDLPAALEREKKNLIKEMELQMNREKETWTAEEIPKELEKERQRLQKNIEERMKEEKNNWKNSELPQEIEKERQKWMKLMEVTLAKERNNWKSKELPGEVNKVRQELEKSLDEQVESRLVEQLSVEKDKIQKESEAKVLEAIEEHQEACKAELQQAIAKEKESLKQKFDEELQERYTSEKKVWREMLDQQLNEKIEIEREKWKRKSESEFNKKLEVEKEKLRSWLRAEFEKKMEAEHMQMKGEYEKKLEAEHMQMKGEFEAEKRKLLVHENTMGAESANYRAELEREFDKRLRSELDSMREDFDRKAKEEYEKMKKDMSNAAKQDFEQYKLALENEMEINLDSQRELIQLKSDREVSRKVEEEELNWKIQFEKELTQKLQKEEEKWKEMIEKDIESRLDEEKQKWESEKLKWESNKQAEWEELLNIEKDKLTEVLNIQKEEDMKVMSERLRENLHADLDEDMEKFRAELEAEFHQRMDHEVQCVVEATREECHREYTMEMSINSTSAEASQGLLREELENMKQRSESLHNELIKKESDWLKEKEDLILQKDLERRKAMETVQEKAEVEYKQFLTEHQDMLDKALKEAREQHNKHKADLENRYTSQIKLLQATIQSLRNQLQDSLNGTQEQSNILAEMEKERLIWYEERDHLIQEISERDSLLGKADVHLSKEVDKLRSELQAAYQRRLESEMSSYKQKLESDYARTNNSEQKEKLQLEKQLSEVNTELKKLKNESGEDKARLTEDKAKHTEEIKKLTDVVNEARRKVDEFDRMAGELKKAKELLKGYKEEMNNYEENAQKYKKDCDDLQNKLNKAIQTQEILQVEIQKLKEEKMTVIESVKAIESSYKQKQDENATRIAKTEKVLQDMKHKYRAELESLRKALEAENDVAMNAMKNKMIELQKTHVTLLDEMRKKHLKEKEMLIKQGHMSVARGVTPTVNSQGEVEEDIKDTVNDLRAQYLNTVAKIKDDVLRHITETNVRAAETVKFEMDKERFSTFHQIKEFYKQNVKQILETELKGSTLENKLLAVEEALENLSSAPSSRSTTPKSDEFMLDEKHRSRSTSRDARDAGISPKGQRSVSFVTSTRGDRSRTPVSSSTKEMAWVGDKSFEDPRSPKGSRYEEGQSEGHKGRGHVRSSSSHGDRIRDTGDLRSSYDWSHDSGKFDTRLPENRPVSAKYYREFRNREHTNEDRPLSAKSPRELHITLRERNTPEGSEHRDRERQRSGEKRKQRTLISTRDIHAGRYTRSGEPQHYGSENPNSRSKSVTPMYSGIAASSPSLYRPTSVPDLSAEDKELKVWTETNNDTYRYTPLRDTLRSGTNLHRSNSKSESDLSLAEKSFGPLKPHYDSNMDLSTGSLTSGDTFFSPRKRDAGETPTSTPRRARKHFTLHSFPTRDQINGELRNHSGNKNESAAGVTSPTSTHSVSQERKNLPLIQFRHGKMTSLSRVGVTNSKSPHPEDGVLHRDTPPTRDTSETPDRQYRPLSVSSNLHLDF